MNAVTTFAKLARMAGKHPEATWELQEEAIHAEVALRNLIAAAEEGAVELIRAGRPAAGNAVLAAVAQFKDVPASTDGILKGNADLVPAKHATLSITVEAPTQ